MMISKSPPRLGIALSSLLLLCGCSSSPSSTVDTTSGDGSIAAEHGTATEAGAGDGAAFKDGAISSCVFSFASGAGPDGTWGTADDVISTGQKAVYEGSSLSTSVILTAGADGKIGTADDVTQSVTRFSYDSAGRVIASRTYTGAGADGQWLTADDVQTQRETFAYDAQGNPTERVVYSGAGKDGVFGTSDDTISVLILYSDYVTFLKQSEAKLETDYTSAGADGVWKTQDDQVYWVLKKTYTEGTQGSYTMTATGCTSAGADNKWNTSDDIVAVRTVWSCDSKGRKMTVYTSSGSDGTWGTSDDGIGQQAFMTSNTGCPFSLCSYKIE
jgi:YD repeat-containing protein